MILLIDNYDSFSYNLYQLIGGINPDIKVIRNDELTVHEIDILCPERIIISPGPGKPSDAGVCVEVVKTLGGKIPILGVCLGHQAIYEAFGGVVAHAKKTVHGKAARITVDTDDLLFNGLPEVITGARYHSLAGIENTLPDELVITAQTMDGDGEIMAVSHKKHKIHGVQFHPESILTPDGVKILMNFMKGGRTND